MCGRYYVNDETAREIEAIIRQADQKLSNKIFGNSSFLAREIHPTDVAPVIVQTGRSFPVEHSAGVFPVLRINR